MKTEREIREILERSIAAYLLNKSEVEFFGSYKPSKQRDRMARLTGRDGYSNRLSTWEEVIALPRSCLKRNYAECFILAEILGEPVHALWCPEDYIAEHRNELSTMLLLEIETRKLGAEAHMRKSGLLVSIF